MKQKLAVSLCAAVAFAAYACPLPATAQSSSNSSTTQQSTSNSQPSSTGQEGASSTAQSGQAASSQSTTGTQAGTNSSTYQNGQNQNNQWQQGSNENANSPAAKQEAMNLVPAQATLAQTLDAKNAQTGQQISAKLQDKVQLKNGPELPKGTVLEGKVTADQAKSNNARLAICFDQAKLSDGREIPVKATVVGIARPRTDNNTTGQMNTPENIAYAATWTPNTLQVDQVNAISGVDLHSRIHSKNSAVFVSQSNNDLKLDQGSRLTLAIGKQQQNDNQNSGGSPSL